MRRHPLREIDLHLQPDGQVGVSYVLHRHGEDGERDCSPIVKSLEEWLNSEHAEGYLPKHVLREAFELDWSDPEEIPFQLPRVPEDFLETEKYEVPLPMEVSRFLAEHATIPDRYYMPLAAWVMATYISDSLPIAPLVTPIGPTMTGKTTLLQALAAIAYRGELVDNPSAPNLRIDSNLYAPSQCIDEVPDDWGPERRSDLYTLLRAGVRPHGIIKRANRDGTGTMKFNVHGLRAYATKVPLPQDILNRSISLVMARGPYAPRLDSELATDIRTRLSSWRLAWRCHKAELPHADAKTFAQKHSLSGRAQMILEALATPLMAFKLEGELEDLVQTVTRAEEFAVTCGLDALEVYIYRALVELGKDKDPPQLRDVHDHVHLLMESEGYTGEELRFKDPLPPEKIGKILSGWGFEKKHTKIGNVISSRGFDEAMAALRRRFAQLEAEPVEVDQKLLEETLPHA